MKKLYAVALAAAALATSAAAPATARELKISSWLPPRSIEGRMYEDFVKDLAKLTKGSLTGRVFHGGQLLSAGATLSGIRDGVVDIGFVVPTIYSSELKHTVVVQNLMHHVTDPWAAAGAALETIINGCDECQGDFARQNMVYLGGHAGTGWNLMCTSPINSLSDIKGKKVRVTGRSATRMVAALGMVAVNLTPAELAPALQGGQIHCAMGYKAWMIDYSLLDTIKAVVDFSLGSYAGLGFTTINKRSYESLTPAERKIMIELQPKYAARGVRDYAAQDKLALERGKAKGIKFVDASPDFVAAFKGFLSTDVANVVDDLKRQGVKDADKLAQQHLATIEKWNKLVKSGGGDPAAYERLLQQEIYSKARF